MRPDPHETEERLRQAQREVLGYLNFSSGAPDPNFLRSLDELYRLHESRGDAAPVVDRVIPELAARLEDLRGEGGAFADAGQAGVTLRLAQRFRETYQLFHQDLLWGIDPERLWRPYFLGRVFEAILAQGPPRDDDDTLNAAQNRLDDYLGYRPIAVLETDQKIEPYRHEWIRPIPLHIESAGTATGVYSDLIERTLEVLRETDADLLRAASFDPRLLDELAVDPRAYDFDHPVHKRPNHHFGQWDPNRIDQQGFYRRFVLQPVVLEALASRIEQGAVEGGALRGELLEEAATVLAGTMLMASGVSGAGPNTHSSEETLATLLPQIAEYRDRFYEQRLGRVVGEHGERLRSEKQQMRQPFAAARQHLNHAIAGRRARQLQRVQLARVYARMGRSEAALRQAHEVRVASSRILCEIFCRLTDGHQALDRHDLVRAAELAPQIEDLVERGIECGALVDPWNVVGFGGNFSLFPALENTVHDYRVDDLIQVVEQLMGLCSRGWTEAAAIDDAAHEELFSDALHRLATWWDKFATPMVSGVRRLLGKEVEVSTNLVAGALNAWHKAGAAAGDVGFWGMFVDQFDSPKAFQQVIEALLDKGDLVASMALLMRWLCQVDLTPLDDGDASFHPLALRWLQAAEAHGERTGEDQWPRVKKFFDHLEANAETLWEAPGWELGMERDEPLDDLLDDDLEEEFFDEEDPFEEGEDAFDSELDEEQEDDLGLFEAAYEGFTFEDSANDGMDSPLYEPSNDETMLEMEEEAQRLEARLAFLKTVSRLWKHAAIAWGVRGAQPNGRRETLAAWRKIAAQRETQLAQLLETVHKHRLPQPRGDHESMVEFDKLRTVKDAIVEGVISAAVEAADAGRLLRAAAGAVSDGDPPPGRAASAAVGVLRSVLRSDEQGVRDHWPQLQRALLCEELLYVPIAKGGDPRKIVRARVLHRLVSDLLDWLPRLGMIHEGAELLEVAQRMEIDHPVGRGAVTEYDRLFETGYEAIVRCLVASAAEWDEGLPTGQEPSGSDTLLVQALQDLTERQLDRWLRHSRTVRLSVVERLADPEEWDRFVRFVDTYGADLFTQRFLTLSNLRAILHQRVSVWLDNMVDEADDESPKLIEALEAGAPAEEAARQLSTAIEAVVENYREYRDYNATTTQSDRGELLHAFIDFLRLRNAYDRVSWNLKPVYLAHKILARGGRPAAAELWRRAVEQRTREAADDHLGRLERLHERYGMRLPTVSQRLAERFVRPLAIDRLRALVGPAMGVDPKLDADESFRAIEEEVASLLDDPAGAGLDAPDWIEALEDEVQDQQHSLRSYPSTADPSRRIEQTRLDWQEAQRQLAPAPPPADDSETEE